MGRARPGVRAATATTIEIEFRYRGARCRERLKLAPTAANLAYAERLRGTVLNAIALGTFDYAKQFPDSKRARKLTRSPGHLLQVGAALDDWLDRKRPELEHTTTIDYERAIRLTLWPAFGRETLRGLTRVKVKTWIAEHPTLSAKRLNNVLSPLRQMLAEALDDGLIEEDPLLGLKVRRRRAPTATDDIDPFSPAEIKLILDAATGQFQNLCRFDFFSGLRTSELIALKWDDVDIVKKTVRIRTAFVRGKEKTTKTITGTRTVELLAPAVEALQAQKAHTFLEGGVVFRNPLTGKAWYSDKSIREHNWRHVLKRAGVRYRYPYQMRHTFASMLLSAGENILWVARQMGHKDPTITARRYARWLPSAAPDAGKKAEDVWRRAGGE